ncbi:hypothetical protein SAY86_029475 [Trapa natans]|uniref:Uncharacterized protein n=1 Tax=Trapa natans TaxID=22666 RepID=A0AAN7R9N6_TRANT|nr:hypothetical protein SAY86_029475 [Trapa natans]
MTISEKILLSELTKIYKHLLANDRKGGKGTGFGSQQNPRVPTRSGRRKRAKVHFKKDHIWASKTNPNLSNRNLRVAVIGGGGFAGGLAEEMLVKGVDTFTMEQKLDNCKPCSGAIPIAWWVEFGQKKTLKVDAVTGAYGANSKVAKSINVGDYECAIAFQVRRLSDVF